MDKMKLWGEVQERFLSDLESGNYPEQAWIEAMRAENYVLEDGCVRYLRSQPWKEYALSVLIPIVMKYVDLGPNETFFQHVNRVSDYDTIWVSLRHLWCAVWFCSQDCYDFVEWKEGL